MDKGETIQQKKIDTSDNTINIKLYKYHKGGYSILISYVSDRNRYNFKEEVHVYVENKDGKQIIRIDYTSDMNEQEIERKENYDTVGEKGCKEFKNGKEILNFLEKLINDNCTAGDLAKTLGQPNE